MSRPCLCDFADRSFLNKTISSVANTARNLEQGLEAQAKKLGVPVDDYKDKAFDLASDAIAKGQQVIHHIQGEAQKAGQEVENKVKEKGVFTERVVRTDPRSRRRWCGKWFQHVARPADGK